MTDTKQGESSRITLFEWASRQLHKAPPPGDQGWLHTFLAKETLTETQGNSRQATNLGDQPRPYDMVAVKQFLTSNEHHSTCIATKVAATVGLGFQTERDRKKKDIGDGMNPTAAALDRTKDWEPTKVDTTLDPLCEHSFQDVIDSCCEDYHQLSIGAIEAVRKGGEQVTGLHYIPVEQMHVFVEDYTYNYHYVIRSPEGTERRFARFGDKQGFLQRLRNEGAGKDTPTQAHFELDSQVQEADTVSEVIVFRKPSSLNRWYPVPKWLSCTASIELVQMLTQYKFDFHLNRGVPEFMLFVMGAKLLIEDWEKIVNALKGGVGLGNSHKSFALNLVDKEMQVQLEKLMADGKEDSWATDNEACALKIVTAHQVPPLLAGIQMPGKLGATNELPNALMAFQALVIGQDQRVFERTLVKTLGAAFPEIKPKDFLLRTILDEIDINQADTVARMRQTVPEAKAQGRDLKAGVKD